jgi:hypothetical protein
LGLAEDGDGRDISMGAERLWASTPGEGFSPVLLVFIGSFRCDPFMQIENFVRRDPWFMKFTIYTNQRWKKMIQCIKKKSLFCSP